MERIAVIGVMSVLLALLLRKDKPELELLVILTGCLLISFLALSKLGELVAFVGDLQKELGSSQIYIGLLLKMVGITYMSEFGANLCRDAGYGAVAGQIEFFGKILLLGVSIPVLMNLLETLQKFWQ